jgi:hypothetical protein
MRDYICHYCNKHFSNKSNLTNHINKAKYCLSERNQIMNKFNCKGCSKNFTSKQSLQTHNKNCIEIKLLNIEEKLKEQKEFYENILKQQKEFYENILKEEKEQIKELNFHLINLIKK